MQAETNEFTFHHIGLACHSLAAEIEAHESLGYVIEGTPFHDPLQRINGIFMVNGPIRIELIEPAGEYSPVRNILTKGLKMYHQCFECTNIHKAISDLEAQGARVIVSPTPAVVFNGRTITFLMLRTLLIVELIQV
ncbi:methylmalonyl-CoA/ethylmalonyl-CoA epimerase [Paenibacillus sp. yr247]|uniref:VOC family protein n=1 Tax=Paenibacillus sp. yr247 TaxID=1761880 RepID=UPI00088A6D75|nr:VOC family protein [Paenibacillus sp. yr247]SDO85235.1 methylmalonyl-CoA/ethylmalonyl-CoA epimerase [Paenibacillus sp. yr247]